MFINIVPTHTKSSIIILHFDFKNSQKKWKNLLFDYDKHANVEL